MAPPDRPSLADEGAKIPDEEDEEEPPVLLLLLLGWTGAAMPEAIWHWVPVHWMGQTHPVLFEFTEPPLKQTAAEQKASLVKGGEH